MSKKGSNVIRVIALLWLSTTLYVSFILFSGKTSIEKLTLDDSDNTDGKGYVRKATPADQLKRVNSDGEVNKMTSSLQLVPSLRKETDRVTDIVDARDDDSVNSTMAARLKQIMLDKFKAMGPHDDFIHEEGHEQKKGWDKYLKYMNKGTRRLWPLPNDKEDRVLNQIHLMPKIDRSKPPKLIYMKWGLDPDMSPGQSRFINHGCPVNWCSLSEDEKDESNADLVFYKDDFGVETPVPNNPNQIALLFLLESPMHTSVLERPVNWTATYRSESVLNAPYERFAYFKNFTGLPEKPVRNFARGKTRKVAWFVSNCFAGNGRMNYAKELGKHIDVDIFGMCGQKTCQRDTEECNNMLRKHYKFYLSFENSNCQDYITEKFFLNALGNDVLPIVMGARPEDYKRLAPPNSYIHVDDFDSPKSLAEYLHKLDKDDKLYNSYFLWKGSGEFIDTKFWCRLCAMLHAQEQFGVRSWYDNPSTWWREGVCVDSPSSKKEEWSTWRNFKGAKKDATKLFKMVKNKKIKNR